MSGFLYFITFHLEFSRLPFKNVHSSIVNFFLVVSFYIFQFTHFRIAFTHLNIAFQISKNISYVFDFNNILVTRWLCQTGLKLLAKKV